MRKIGALKFGGIDVIVYCQETVLVDEVNCWGCYSSASHRILLREGMPKGRFFNTLIHEMAHACLDTFCISNEDKVFENEEICDAMALGVGQNIDSFDTLWKSYRKVEGKKTSSSDEKTPAAQGPARRPK